MAGRGRAATLPAWMTGGAATVAAPGAPAATGAPAAGLSGGPAAPGSTAAPAGPNAALMQAQAIAASLVAQHPGAAPAGASATGTNNTPIGLRAPMSIPSSTTTGGAAAPSPTGAATGQPNPAAVAAAIAAAQAAAAGISGGAPTGAPAAAATPAPASAAAGSNAPSAVYGARPPGVPGLGPAAAAGAPPMAGPPYGFPPPGAYPPPIGGVPPMFRPPIGMFPPGMLPPPGMGYPGQPMYTPPAAAVQPAAAPAAAQQQQQQPKSDWSEHTAPDGRKYYYNSVTKTSSWVKPEELMTPEEKAKAAADKPAAAATAAAAASSTPASQSTPAAVASPAAAATSATTSATAPAAAGSAAAAAAGGISEVAKAWKQYTAPDGRPYFYNKITKESKWTMPEEMKAAKAAEAEAKAASAPAASKAAPVAASNGVTSKHDAETAAEDVKAAAKPEPVKQEPIKYATKEAAKEAFKQLLQDFDIPAEASWDNAMRLIIHDVRYGALKAMGEKKSAFNEYCTARRAAEREEARRKQIAAKEAFMTLLEDTPELEPGDSFDRAQRLLNHDGRWKEVESDALRRELFKDHMDALKRKKAEEAKRKQEKAVAAFKELLQRSQLKSTSSWRKVSAKLEDEEAYQGLDRLARLEVFQAHIRHLEEEEKQEKEREKEAKRRKERKNRDAFRALLQRHRDEGTINVHMRWKEYQPLVEDSEEYVAVKKNTSGSRPRELFEDLILEMEEEYDKARPLLKEALKAAGWSVAPDSTYQDYCEVLEAQATAAAGEDGSQSKLAGIRDSHKRAYFEQEVGRAKEKAAEADKKKKRALEKFEAFVRSAEGLYSNTTWQEFEEAFRDEAEFVAVGAEVAMRVFDEHIEKLKAKEKKRDRDDEEDGKDKKKKRSSRHDDDDHKKSKRHRRDRSRDKSRDRSRERSRDKSRGKDHRKRSPDSAEPEEGEV